MSEDRMLDALARLIEDDSVAPPGPYDEQLEALGHDRLDESARRALLGDAERSTELAVAVEAYRPLNADFKAGMTDRILGQLRAEAQAPRQGLAESTPEGSKGWLERLWSWPSRWFLLPAVAAVAAVLLVLNLPRSHSGLPLYSIELSGGLRTERNGTTAREDLPVLGPGGRLDVVLRPAAAVRGVVDARVFAASGGQWVPLEIPAEVAPTGAVRLLVSGRDLDFAPSGTLELRIAVGRPDSLPDTSEIARGSAAGARWQLLTASIIIAEAADPL